MRASPRQATALAAMPAHAVCPLVGAQTRKTERARPQREPTKPNSERTARRSAHRLLLSGRIGHFDAGKTEYDAFIELNAQRLRRGLHHASGGRAGRFELGM